MTESDIEKRIKSLIVPSKKMLENGTSLEDVILCSDF
jgi:hypothetical protein